MLKSAPGLMLKYRIETCSNHVLLLPFIKWLVKTYDFVERKKQKFDTDEEVLVEGMKGKILKCFPPAKNHDYWTYDVQLCFSAGPLAPVCCPEQNIAKVEQPPPQKFTLCDQVLVDGHNTGRIVGCYPPKIKGTEQWSYETRVWHKGRETNWHCSENRLEKWSPSMCSRFRLKDKVYFGGTAGIVVNIFEPTKDRPERYYEVELVPCNVPNICCEERTLRGRN